jgi:serine phosphatase RsbU (regulator of sigma subunit)
MHELWSSASYEPHLLSLPFAFAPAVMTVVIAYAVVMRGEPVLRIWMLLHFVALMPYSIVMALSPSVTSPVAEGAMFRIAASFIPMAAAAGAGFQLGLLGLLGRPRWRLFVWIGVAIAIAWLAAGALTDAAVGGVYRLRAGLWYATAGRWAWLALLSTLFVASPGFVLLARAALRKPSPRQSPSERRQLRLILVANVVTYAGLTDVALAYHVGVFPLGWLLSGIGSVLVVRALIFEDLLRVRAVDTTVPQVLLHFGLAMPLAWVSLAMLGDRVSWWGAATTVVVCFAAVRVTIAVFGLVSRGARAGESTLDRLLAQLVHRARAMRSESEVAQLAIDIIELGLGVHVEVLIAAAEDYGWTTASGQRLADELAPDPLLGAWLAEQRGAIFDDELAEVPDDLHELLARVFAGGPDQPAAHTLVPITSHDELLSLLLVPATAKRLRGSQLAFLERAAERLGEGLVHTRMAQRAAARATLAREVELAATVQVQLLPGRGPHVHGDVTVVGSWLPATRCAGDFWGVYPLAGGRVLVAIGDVTGHGVASATVTAAAAAACDVAVRRHGAALDLDALVGALDAAVARVGGGELSMTCFAAILDPGARTIHYVSCGHPTPYVCSADLELQALVGRGNPLGSGSQTSPKVQHRVLRAGDLLVWYTDGVIEAQDPSGEPFGDRRLQRMLRRLDRATLAPPAVHDLVFASVAAHRAGRPRSDDETLVIAQWAPPPAASTEPSKQAST